MLLRMALNRFTPGQNLFDQMIATIRGIVKIEQDISANRALD